ncbi:hypothetical protein DMH12_19015 [Streptomyces sp. WAC 04229]|nr:hypothetical protein DMH12_19015 [Streptomyces sp. WAC 04229]
MPGCTSGRSLPATPMGVLSGAVVFPTGEAVGRGGAGSAAGEAAALAGIRAARSAAPAAEATMAVAVERLPRLVHGLSGMGERMRNSPWIDRASEPGM